MYTNDAYKHKRSTVRTLYTNFLHNRNTSREFYKNSLYLLSITSQRNVDNTVLLWLLLIIICNNDHTINIYHIKLNCVRIYFYFYISIHCFNFLSVGTFIMSFLRSFNIIFGLILINCARVVQFTFIQCPPTTMYVFNLTKLTGLLGTP